MKPAEIKIADGVFASVDSDWAEILSMVSWSKLKAKNGLYYARSSVYGDGKHYQELLHRIIVGALPNEQVDHIDGNPLNNKRNNLRICNQSQNMMNITRNVEKTSKHKGVWRDGNRWCSKIQKEKKVIWLGSFSSETEAALAYNEAARKYHGEFAVLNEVSNEDH